MSAPQLPLRAGAATLQIGPHPLLMGIVNATPDSFSDAGLSQTLEARVARAHTLVSAGAAIIDIGGESGVTNRPAVAAEEEIERVVPLIGRVVDELDVVVSVDTYKPPVAAAAIAAGATIVNDISGLRDPGLADVCAETGAALVLMHNRAAPKQKLLDPSLDGRVVADIEAFLRERIELALGRGVAFEQLMLDPGPDFGKTPGQTVELMRGLGTLHGFGRPLLLAASRKDFIGAITGRPPRERLAGTLAAVGYGVDAGVHVLRVHDVGETAEFLAVGRVLAGEQELRSGARLADSLRWQQGPQTPA
jgi:dihydropteroate synthase